MNKYISRIFITVLLVPCCVGFVASLSSSDLETDESVAHPAEIRLMEELAAWTGETPTSSPSRPFPEEDSLATSVQQYAESFTVFRQVAGQHGRAAALANIPYGAQIQRASGRYKVDPLLIAAIVAAESSFNPLAVSPVGAQGLMQLMPETAKYLGASDEDFEGEVDPLRNLELGALYVKRLMKLYGDDIPLVLAAYNSGPGNVRKFGGIPPFSETQRYVEKVLERYIDLNNAAYEADRFQQADLDGDSVAGS